MDYLKIRNWDKWQSYRKDRGQPPWIKIHRRLLRNPEWVSLGDSERGQLVAIWLLAADHDGVIPASPDIIQKLCYMSKTPNLNKFIELDFIESNGRQVDANLTSSGSQDVTPEAEAEAEADKNRIKTLEQKVTHESYHFDSFWQAYPKRKNRAHALKAWKKLNSPAETLNKILIALEWQKNCDQWLKENGQYIPYPATYLNARSWEDEPDGHKNDGGVDGNLFLRTIREERERETNKRLGGLTKPVPGQGHSQGGSVGNGTVPENANPAGRNPEDDSTTG